MDEKKELFGKLDQIEAALHSIRHVLEENNKQPAPALHDFVWAMYQIRHGLAVRCLADDSLYAAVSSGRPDVRFGIQFGRYVVDSPWTLDPACMPCAVMPEKLKEGTFEWAMQQLKNGKEVVRRDWYNDGFPIRWKLGDFNTFVLNDDIYANDWEVYHEPHDIKWAAQQLQNDKIVKRRGWGIYMLYPHSNINIDVEDIVADDWELAEEDD